MSGHSRWAQIKHKKAVKDVRRGRLFTRILKEITVAARLGGGAPDGNPRLRAAIHEAKASRVPAENFERAIKKGTGELAGGAYEEVGYEGYGPGGAALMIETATDNKNRTVQEIRHLFDRHGGHLGENGSVAWMFRRRGYFAIDRHAMNEERFMELAVELGVEDVATTEEVYEIYTSVEDFNRVRERLETLAVPTLGRELAMIPTTTVAVAEAKALQLLRLIDALEDHDDVQKVWANFDIAADVLAAHAG